MALLQRREREPASEILDRVPLKRPVNRRRRRRHETSQRRSPVLVAAVHCNLINPTTRGAYRCQLAATRSGRKYRHFCDVLRCRPLDLYTMEQCADLNTNEICLGLEF